MFAGQTRRPSVATVISIGGSIHSIPPLARAQTENYPDWPRYSITTIDLAIAEGVEQEDEKGAETEGEDA